MTADGTAARSGQTFGLWLTSEFDIPGLDEAPSLRPLPRCELHLTDERTAERLWGSAPARRLSAVGGTESSPASTIDFRNDLGFRLSARYFGTCFVSLDGGRVNCLPPAISTWRWQRFLVGRILPLAALCRGYEVLHASAVAFDDHVIAIAGPSGWGKTSLAINLMLASEARFFTDDVLSIELRDGRPVVHPGIGVTNLRLVEEERLGHATIRVGALLGQTGRQKSHYQVQREARSLPLKRLYFLAGGTGRRAEIQPVEADPRRLLGSAFIVDCRDAESLTRLLDVSAALSESVEMFEIARGTDEGPAELAQRLVHHAAG